MSSVEFSVKHKPLIHKNTPTSQEMIAAIPSESLSLLVANRNVFIVNPVTCENIAVLNERVKVAREGRLVLVGIDPKTKAICSLKVHQDHLSKRRDKFVDGLVATYLQQIPSMKEIQVRKDCEVYSNDGKSIKLVPMTNEEYQNVFNGFSEFVCAYITAIKQANSVKP